MSRFLVGSAVASVLAVVAIAPLSSALLGTTPTRWDFKFDDRGVWHAQGAHVSFSWTLAPFQIYDLMVDGVMLFDELEFPMDADAYMTEGAAFKVMKGDEMLFKLNDNPTAHMMAMCSAVPPDPQLPPDPCHLEFPEGSEVMPMAAGGGKKTSLFHVEYPEIEGSIRPCGTLAVRGTVTVDMSMVMFNGALDLHYPPGQSMEG